MSDDDSKMETDKNITIGTNTSPTQITNDVRITDAAFGREISSTSVKLQPLWTASPLNWFRVAELQFETQQIKSEKTKFLHVLGALMPETCNLISDFFECPPMVNQYQKLKAVLLERLAPSEEQKLAQLLTGHQIGEGKPSEILRSIRSLASTNLSAVVIRSFWIRRMPEIIRIAIAAQPAEQSLEELAKMADRMYEAMQTNTSHINAIASNNQKFQNSQRFRPTQRNEQRQELPMRSTQTKTVEERLTKIEEQLNQLVQRNRSQSQGWSQKNRANSNYNRANQRQRSPSRPNTNRYCILHYRYREKARSCYPPCSWTGSQPLANQATTENNPSTSKNI